MEYRYSTFIIKPDEKLPTLVRVVTSGRGGKIPSVLSGLFTSVEIAKTIIDRYNSERKGVNNVDEAVSKD